MTDEFQIVKKRLEIRAPQHRADRPPTSASLHVDGWLSLIQGKEAIALCPEEVEQLRGFLETENPKEEPLSLQSCLERVRLQPSGARARGAIQEALRLFVSEHIGRSQFAVMSGVIAMAEKAGRLGQLSHMSAALGRVTLQLEGEHLEAWHWVVSSSAWRLYPVLEPGLQVAQAACGFLLERRAWWLGVPKETRELVRDMVEVHGIRARHVVESDP